MSVQTTATPKRNWVDVARGLGALIGVIALVVGVPLALIAWVGWPLPEEMTSIDEVTGALRDRFIPDAFLIKALAVVCWLVWIELMASLIVETVAYLRGRQAGRVPLAGGMQRAAARLVATVALLGALVGTKGLPNMVRQPLTPITSTAPATLVADTAPKETVESAPAPAPLPTYQVQRRDTLWDIAERHLGDPFRWVEIYEVSKDLPQPDGRTLTDPDLIYPGWQLRLPPDAIGLAPLLAPAPTPAPAPAGGGSGGSDGGDGTVKAPAGGELGMVLLGDGSGGGSGPGVVVAPPNDAAVTARDPGGMVLLPVEVAGGQGPDDDQAPDLAEPDDDADRSIGATRSSE
jgi:LysM domain